MQVYFQVGMIIGDTEQHNKQYITYDHTHLKVDMHPAKTIHPEIIILVRIFECRIQILTAFVVTTMSGNAGKDYHKSNGDNLTLRRLKLYHKCYSEFLYSAFKDPDQYYDLWVYGFGWMQVYFQMGMIIGDME